MKKSVARIRKLPPFRLRQFSKKRRLYGLKKVVLRYTVPLNDGSEPVQFDLIDDVFADLVACSEGGEPEMVSSTCS